MVICSQNLFYFFDITVQASSVLYKREKKKKKPCRVLGLAGLSLTTGAPISNPARPQVTDSGTAPRYRSWVITLADRLATAVEDDFNQADGPAVLFKYPLSPAIEEPS